MIVYENECCGCAVPGYPCIGDACSLTHVPHIYCDICGEEIFDDDADVTEDYHVCKDCDDEEEDEDDEGM